MKGLEEPTIPISGATDELGHRTIREEDQQTDQLILSFYSGHLRRRIPYSRSSLGGFVTCASYWRRLGSRTRFASVDPTCLLIARPRGRKTRFEVAKLTNRCISGARPELVTD